MLFCPSAENAVSCCLMHYIHVDVWDHDMLNRDDFMGRVVIPITTLTEEMLSGWFPLGRMTSKNNVSGEIYLEISLKATQVPRGKLHGVFTVCPFLSTILFLPKLE